MSHPPNELPFWEQPETVEMFAGRPPDKRMLAWLMGKPKSTRVLDLGCAGGRNSEWLAREGFDFYAVDTSNAMLAKTHERVATLLGEQEADKRVLKRPMNTLEFEDDFFDLIIALGVIQGAQSVEEWHETVAGLARILKPQGHMLVAHFSPKTDITGEGLTTLEGEKHLFEIPKRGRNILLLELEELDTWMGQHGFNPITPSSQVFVQRDDGHHTTVNAHYQKEGGDV